MGGGRVTPAVRQRLTELYRARGVAHAQIVTILTRVRAVNEDAPVLEVFTASAEYWRQRCVERYGDGHHVLAARRHALAIGDPVRVRRAA